MPQRAKAPSDYFLASGLREIKLLREYFRVVGTGDDVHIAGPFPPVNVTHFYREYFAAVRPPKLRFENIFPQPSPIILRALYMGQPDANSLLNAIVRHALYVDQLLIVDPFLTVVLHDHPKSVQRRPEIWMTTLVNRALCLCALEEWIRQGIVMLVPSVFYYHPEILKVPSEVRITAAQRQAFERRTIREMLLAEAPKNRDALLDLLVRMGKEMPPTMREELLREADQYERENPIRFRLTAEYDKYFAKFQTRSEMFTSTLGGLPLFHAPELAAKMGAFLIFEYQETYEELMANVAQTDARANSFQRLSLAFQRLDFPFLHNVPVGKALQLRNQGYLTSFRNYLRELWQAVSTVEDVTQLDGQIADFVDRLTAEYTQLEREWEQIRKDLVTSAVITGAITGLTVVASGNIQMALGAAAAGLAGITGAPSVKDLRQTTQEPLAVFLKLAH